MLKKARKHVYVLYPSHNGNSLSGKKDVRTVDVSGVALRILSVGGKTQSSTQNNKNPHRQNQISFRVKMGAVDDV